MGYHGSGPGASTRGACHQPGQPAHPRNGQGVSVGGLGSCNQLSLGMCGRFWPVWVVPHIAISAFVPDWDMCREAVCMGQLHPPPAWPAASQGSRFGCLVVAVVEVAVGGAVAVAVACRSRLRRTQNSLVLSYGRHDAPITTTVHEVSPCSGPLLASCYIRDPPIFYDAAAYS